jgi:MarR family transcriptional regulator for hemolysin
MKHSDIGYLLNRATRQFRLRLGDSLADTGLTPQQAAVLMAIARSTEGRLTPSAVADAVDTDAATTSGLLDRLTRDEWIASEPNPDDGRSRLVGLTDRSSQTLPAVMAAANAVSAEATACLSPDEVETLANLLHRICQPEATLAAKRRAGSR